jgi:voltage-gated potassium channel Kch
MKSEILDKHIYRLIVSWAVATVATGTIVYHFAEHWSWINSYYFSVVTLATVGYGDFVPTTTFAKIFTTFYIFIGVGILTTFITATMKRRGAKIANKHLDKRTKE